MRGSALAVRSVRIPPRPDFPMLELVIIVTSQPSAVGLGASDTAAETGVELENCTARGWFGVGHLNHH
jgi:hypothetical protein